MDEAWPTWFAPSGGSVWRSIRPAIQAAGSMPSARTRKPSTPARQPKSVMSVCPSGADKSAPSEPDAVIAPSTMLRDRAGTARELWEILP